MSFDKGHVDCVEYEVTEDGIYYVTRLKDNAVYKAFDEYE